MVWKCEATPATKFRLRDENTGWKSEKSQRVFSQEDPLFCADDRVVFRNA